MTTTSRNADILIRDANGKTLAVVEVQNIKDLTLGEAIQLRHNLVTYGVPFQVPFFMLLSQDIGFLWKDSKYENLNSPPPYVFPMENVVASFSDRKAGERLYKAEFEILAVRWLNRLTLNTQNANEEPERILALSGFIEAIKGADVLLEAGL